MFYFASNWLRLNERNDTNATTILFQRKTYEFSVLIGFV